MPAPKWLTRPLWAGSGLQVSIASMSAQADKRPIPTKPLGFVLIQKSSP